MLLFSLFCVFLFFASREAATARGAACSRFWQMCSTDTLAAPVIGHCPALCQLSATNRHKVSPRAAETQSGLITTRHLVRSGCTETEAELRLYSSLSCFFLKLCLLFFLFWPSINAFDSLIIQMPVPDAFIYISLQRHGSWRCVACRLAVQW